MGIQFDRFRKLWSATVATRRTASQEALDTLHSAIEKTEPIGEEAAWPPFPELVSPPEGERNNQAFKSLERLAQVVNPTRTWASEEGRNREREVQILQSIEVTAFVGSSGTGKSTRAIELSHQLGIRYFIDDGLLIQGSRIVCGTSAKRAPTRMESVRQAIFLDETRAENMKRALLEQHPDRLMILGTSDAMLYKICTNLGLSLPKHVVRIEEITTEEERRIAKQTRLQAGQHTIPVPSLEIKHEFNGTFLEPLSRLKKRLERDRSVPDPYLSDNEKTVVRPTFSSLGSYSISDEAMRTLTLLILRRVEGLADVLDVQLTKEAYGVVFSIEISLFYGFNAQEIMKQIQQLLAREVERFTAINVMSVDVKARRVVLAKRSVRAAQ